MERVHLELFLDLDPPLIIIVGMEMLVLALHLEMKGIGSEVAALEQVIKLFSLFPTDYYGCFYLSRSLTDGRYARRGG